MVLPFVIGIGIVIVLSLILIAPILLIALKLGEILSFAIGVIIAYLVLRYFKVIK